MQAGWPLVGRPCSLTISASPRAFANETNVKKVRSGKTRPATPREGKRTYPPDELAEHDDARASQDKRTVQKKPGLY